jgi:hypothetical protein
MLRHEVGSAFGYRLASLQRTALGLARARAPNEVVEIDRRPPVANLPHEGAIHFPNYSSYRIDLSAFLIVQFCDPRKLLRQVHSLLNMPVGTAVSACVTSI